MKAILKQNKCNRARLLRARRRSGQSLVEMALVTPLLLMLVMGVLQLGIVLNARISLSNLSRFGARYASANYYSGVGNNFQPDSDIVTQIKTAAAATSIDPRDLTITIDPPQGDPERITGNAITVTLSYPMTKKIFIKAMPGMSKINGTFTIAGACVMQPLNSSSG